MKRLPYVLLVASFACGEQKSEVQLESLAVEDVAAYWAVRGQDREGNNYIHPVLRFKVRNGNGEEVSHVQAMAVFEREGLPDEPWGNAFLYSIAETPIPAGEATEPLTMRCDSNFISKDSPEQMFKNEKWEDVGIKLFLRVGPSKWRPALETDVPRQIGAPGVERFISPEEPEEPSEPPPPAEEPRALD